MRRWRWIALPVTAVALAAVAVLATRGAGAGAEAMAPPALRVVTTTSMLECAVRDLAGEGVHVARLVPPGSCPGHFDLAPGDLETVRAADLVLLPGYQRSLADRLQPPLVPAGRLVVVPEETSPLVPGGYAELLAGVASRLAGRIAAPAVGLDPSLARRRRELDALGGELRQRARVLRGVRTVCSVHVADLCRWLGMDVAGTLPRNGDGAPRALLDAVASRPALVAASLQEGTAAARAVAERSGAAVAVLSTFPGAPGFGAGYEELLRADVDRLVRAWKASGSASGE